MAVVRYPELVDEVESFMDEFDFDPTVRLFVAKGTSKLVKTDHYQNFAIKNKGSSAVNISGFFARHYNNPSNVEIYMGGQLVNDYSRIPEEFADAPVLVSGMKVQGNPSTIQNMNIDVSFANMWGAAASNLVSLSAYFSADQYQSRIVEVPLALILNGYIGLDFTVPAGETVNFTLFVRAIQKNDALLQVWIKRTLEGGSRKKAVIPPSKKKAPPTL